MPALSRLKAASLARWARKRAENSLRSPADNITESAGSEYTSDDGSSEYEPDILPTQIDIGAELTDVMTDVNSSEDSDSDEASVIEIIPNETEQASNYSLQNMYEENYSFYPLKCKGQRLGARS